MGMRTRWAIADTVVAAGILLISFGAGMIHVPTGVMTLGALLGGCGVAIDLAQNRRQPPRDQDNAPDD